MPDNKPNKHDFLDQLSTTALENLIMLSAESDDPNEFESALILKALDVIAKREHADLSSKYPDVHKALDSFNKNYRFVGNGKSLYDDQDAEFEDRWLSSAYEQRKPKTNKDTHKFGRRKLGRLALTAAVLITLLLSASVVAGAFGINLWSFVTSWTDETFEFVNTSSSPVAIAGDPLGTELSDLQSAVVSYDISADIVPTWIPEGYELTELNVSDKDVKSIFNALYQNGEKTISIYIQALKKDNGNSTHEKDDNEIIIYEKGGVEHYIMKNLKQIKAVWINENCECSISGNLEMDELKKMIDSIYERK